MNIRVYGQQTLSGEVHPSGSKNSAVALIPSTILFEDEVVFENVPEITDVERLLSILQKMGSIISWNRQEKLLKINNSKISFLNLGREDLGNMRGTSLLWGAMLARFKKVIFNELPGGCTLGFRTLDPHYSAFRDLGVKVRDEPHKVGMDASKAKAATVWLSEMSPTATENAIMLATSIKGKTRLIGAASEPQVQELCNFLIGCGAKIYGLGSNILEIEGGHKLTPKKYRLLSDHYEISTFLALGAATGGEIVVHDAVSGLFTPVERVFSKFGVKIEYRDSSAVVKANQEIKILADQRGLLVVKAQPWPALPVDILPLFIPLALVAKKGQVLFHNWMYEAGLFWTTELQKLGANVIISDPHRVVVIAGNKLRGATLEAPYIIRAVVAMVMSAMVAKGESLILNADALYRGHPHFSENLRKLGARIEEVP